MPRNRCLFLIPFGFVILLFISVAGITQAQNGRQNPTPIVITLTPVGQPTITSTPTEDSSLRPDRFEPNNDAGTATSIGLQTEPGLTLTGDDVDYFTGYLKTGQIVRISTTVYEGVDTRLELYWNEQLAAENDDRSPADVGSTVTFTAPADGWYLALLEKATFYDGVYDLEATLVEPTTTPTSVPTLTPSPTVLPSATPTSIPSLTPTMQTGPAEPNNTPGTALPITPVATPLTNTISLTATERITLTVAHVGRVQPQATTATTRIRLLVYYDANNDRQPGPGEGIPNVSVLAVDTQGQQIARVFTNVQGEVIFNLTSEAVARVIVPFVPGWSAQIRAGETNNDIVLGLPAVRLPVFLPVQNRQSNDE
jgi:hypothetical protein